MTEPFLAAADPSVSPFYKEGLLAYAAGLGRPERPEHKDMAALRAMTEDQRWAYDEQRATWHSNLGPYSSPEVESVLEELFEVVHSNRQTAEKVRSSAAVDGYGGVGKTTLLLVFAKRYHLERVHRLGERTASGNQRLPVCAITLGGNVTRLGLNEALLHFYGWPAPKGLSADRLTPYVHAAVRACGTEVLLVDDIHHLVATTKDGRDVGNHIKSMSSTLSITWVFGGKDVRKAGLLTEGETEDTGRQPTGRRTDLIPVHPFPAPAAGGDDQWTRLLKACERDIVLAKAKQGMLYNDCRQILWDKTGGNLASLHNLLRKGCGRAVRRGTETLTPDLFRTLRADSSAQLHYEHGGGTWTASVPAAPTPAPARKRAV